MTGGRSHRFVGSALLLTLLIAGCSHVAARPRIRGQVTFHGKPVGGRTLTLVSEGAPGEFFTQKISLRADGTFEGEVPSPGTYKVVIEEALAVQEGRKTAPANRLTIPAKYRAAATSDRVWPIQAGDNYRDIDLEE
jgi:hypothetical protein